MTGLLYNTSVPVADGIEFKVHTLGEIFEFGEAKYYSAISAFVATPWDYMWPLHEAGIDYEELSDFELFLGLYISLTQEIIEFLFGDTFPLYRMRAAENKDTGEIVLIDPENIECQFNKNTLFLLANTIRAIHHQKYERHEAGNAEAKRYFLENARKAAMRAKRRRGTTPKSTLEPYIVSLVNAPEFPYTYESCKEVTIYQFMCSLNKIPTRLAWNFTMHGVHVGMIDGTKVDWQQLNWLS